MLKVISGKSDCLDRRVLEVVPWVKTHVKLRAKGKGVNNGLALFFSIGNDRAILILGL